MTAVYIVRCRFTEPGREEAWNAWYSGPKIKQMLSQPFFLTCQRFRRSAGTGRDYLALWTLESPEALKTRQYVSQWGFAEWAPYITDWSRDLFDAGERPASAFAVPSDGALQVVAFDGISEPDTHPARSRVDAMMWLPVIGLDRHTPTIGLAVRRAHNGTPQTTTASGVQDGIYRPICDVVTPH